MMALQHVSVVVVQVESIAMPCKGLYFRLAPLDWWWIPLRVMAVYSEIESSACTLSCGFLRYIDSRMLNF